MKAPPRSRALLVLGGVMLISPDGTILTAMRASLPTILVLRGAFMAVAFGAVATVRSGWRRDTWRIGRGGAVFAMTSVGGNILFVSSLRNTSIAHTLLIAATVPAITAGLSRIVHGEPIPRKTLLAAGGVLLGVGVLVLSDPGKAQLLGDFEALGAAVSLATGLLVVPRDGRLPAAQAVGAAAVFVVALPWANVSTLHAHDMALGAIGFLVLIPCASSIVLNSRRHLTATHVSLLMMTESVFGPMWGWIGLGQQPSWQTAVAAAIILASVGGHTATDWLHGIDTPFT